MLFDVWIPVFTGMTESFRWFGQRPLRRGDNGGLVFRETVLMATRRVNIGWFIVLGVVLALGTGGCKKDADTADTSSSGNPSYSASPVRQGATTTDAVPGEPTGKSTDIAFVIEPLVGTKDVRFGKRVDRLTEIFGRPSAVRGNSIHEYAAHGFSIATDGGRKIEQILCGSAPSFPKPEWVERCKFRTKEGILMGSSRADIVSAYGTPESEKPLRGNPNTSFLRYGEMDAGFLLIDDELVYMAFGSKR